MVTHIVFWNLKDELSVQEKNEMKKRIKSLLEALPGKIKGLKSAQVGDNFNSKGCDLCLYSILESKEALEYYQRHPDHLAAASVVRANVKERWVVDFES